MEVLRELAQDESGRLQHDSHRAMTLAFPGGRFLVTSALSKRIEVNWSSPAWESARFLGSYMNHLITDSLFVDYSYVNNPAKVGAWHPRAAYI